MTYSLPIFRINGIKQYISYAYKQVIGNDQPLEINHRSILN